MKKLLPYLLLLPLLSGCSALSALMPSFGDGPSVNTNAQVGAENNQALSQVNRTAGDNSEFVESETINEINGKQINNNGLHWWVWVLIGWMIPGPGQIVCENIREWRRCRGRTD